MALFRLLAWLMVALIVLSSPVSGETLHTGLDVLDKSACRELQGKRVGLITNAGGISAKGERNYRLMLRHGVNLKYLMAPEHGFSARAEAGKSLGGTVVDDTLKVYSLYGASKKPDIAQLEAVDVLVFDLQDIGARCYTYISTMKNAMEACSKEGVAFMVLDRPNPIMPLSPSGFMLDKGYESFVGAVDVPFIHGMTVGEIALFLKKTRFRTLDLKVIAMQGYRRGTPVDEYEGFRFVSPSPNIKSTAAALVYPATVFLEATKVSEGRGSDAPFMQFGAPFIDSARLLQEVQACRLPGVEFSSVQFVPKSGKFRSEQCFGLKLRVSDRKHFSPFTTSAVLLLALQKLYPSNLGLQEGGAFFDRLAGTPLYREMILKQVPLEVITEASRKDVLEFERMYPERFIYPEQ
jgi:uncharacterized protein YbbC (DUF1343 family)